MHSLSLTRDDVSRNGLAYVGIFEQKGARQTGGYKHNGPKVLWRESNGRGSTDTRHASRSRENRGEIRRDKTRPGIHN